MSLKRINLIIVLICLIFVPLAQPVRGAISDKTADEKSNSIIVQYKGSLSPTEVRLHADEDIEAAIRRYAADPAVEYAEPNYVYQAALLSNDTDLSNQWYLRRVRAIDGWGLRSSSPQIIIAVIDSGVQIDHPDLDENLWVNSGEVPNNNKDDDKNGFIDDRYGWDFVNNVADPSPKFKPGFTEAGILHGTIVAGIAAAEGNNGQGVAGVSWDARIMSLKALDDQGDGSTTTVVRAIDYAIAKGANIINMSFVGFAYSRSLRDAIKRAHDAGVIVVAPAGNEQSDGSGVNLNTKPIYPACYHDDQGRPLVVGVAATDGVDQKAAFSGYGDTCITLAAPGVSFYSTSVYAPQYSIGNRIFNQYYEGYWSGTSVAVPLVSGTLALILASDASLSASEAIKVMLDSTDNINELNPDYAGQLGRGRLNVFQALTHATAGPQASGAILAMAPASGDSPNVRFTDTANQFIREFSVYRPSFKGGVSLASGDVDGDGTDELIVAPGPGMESEVKVYDQMGNFKSHFLAYPLAFRGGVHVASADVNGDGKAEIITAPRAGIRSDIKIFSAQGKLIKSFLAYPDSFRGGATVAADDVMGDSLPEIITGTGTGGVPQVKVFSASGQRLTDFVTDKARTPTGLNILLLDLDGSSRRLQSEIVVTRQSGPSTVSAFDFRGVSRGSWIAYGPNFRGNIRAVAADLDADGIKEIVTAPVAGGGPHVRIFDRFGQLRSSFYAYAPAFTGGVSLAILSTKR